MDKKTHDHANRLVHDHSHPDGPDEPDVWFPNEVGKANVRGDSLIKAFRHH